MEIFNTLNDKQKEAVFHKEGPLLILAGAGSGKTRVLTHRIAYLIKQENVKPWNIMAITFTNKAAAEMRERVNELVDLYSESIWVSTFHSSCVRILRRYIDRLSYDNNFTIYDTEDQKKLIKEVCKRLNIDTKTYKEKSLLSAISFAKNELMSPDNFYSKTGNNYYEDMVRSVYSAYQRELKKNNALDFDDLLMKTVELFEKDEEVLAYYQDKFKYIMVDEYQDTNMAQFRLVSLLAEKHQNLCVVGDDDQSIYKFRGADIKNILSFEEKFRSAKVVKLEQNYRSSENILNVANEIIKNNVSRKDKKLWTENDRGNKLQFFHIDNAYIEASKILEEIEDLKDRGYSYNDSACLYRTNAQSRILEEEFLRRNVPYKIFGGVNFYQRREIKDILAYLKTVDNGRDDIAVKRIINIPKRGIGEASVNKVQLYADKEGLNFYEALLQADRVEGIGRTSKKLEDFVSLIEELREFSKDKTIRELLELVIDKTAYVDNLKKENTEEALGRIENIGELVSKAVNYEENTETPSLSEFLEEIALIADIDSLEESGDYVALMTIHNSKGLEFNNVFLCGMEEGLFPSFMALSSGDEEALEEERRLCYVAVTRARENLIMTSARQRMQHGETRYNNVSRFITEIPDKYLSSNLSSKKIQTIASTYKNVSEIKPEKAFIAKDNRTNLKLVLDYGVGDKVSHMRFGNGLVLEIVEGKKDYEVTVDFEKVGVKKMFSGFAKLKKL